MSQAVSYICSYTLCFIPLAQDVVEVHLLAEISAKRENFFEAAGVLADLRASLRDTYHTVTTLRQHVRTFHRDSDPKWH